MIQTNDSARAAGGVAGWMDDPMIMGCDTPTYNNKRFGITYINGVVGYSDNHSTTSLSVPSTPSPKSTPMLIGIARDKGGSNNDIFSIQGTRVTHSGTSDINQYGHIVFGGAGTAGNNHAGSTFIDEAVAEVILYSAKFGSLPDFELVETYLALKYGIELTHDYFFLGNSSQIVYHLDGVFDNSIFGIARADLSKINQRISMSSLDDGLVLMNGGQTPTGTTFPFLNNSSYPSSLSDNQYQIIGDDNGAPTFTKSFGGGSANKLGRTFKVTDVGGVGPVTLWFKNSTYSALAANQTYYLSYGGDPNLGLGETFVRMDSIPGTFDYYVTVDFPNNDTTYFTITKDSAFSGPANIVHGLEFWVKSDSGLTGGPTAISSWLDLSENGHSVVMSSPNGTINTIGQPGVNYHEMVSGASINRTWVTAPFRGKTILAVGKISGGLGNQAGYVGFDGDKGLRNNSGNPDISAINVDDWTNGGGSLLRKNGVGITPARIDTAGILYGQRNGTTPYAMKPFYLGGYFAGRSFANYDFSEIIVYDRNLTAVERQRLESHLAIKYGITLPSNYLNASGTVLYSIATYNKGIFGIARNDLGLLMQQQSFSNEKEGVLSVALDSHKDWDRTNTGVFAGDNHSLMFGHNGADGTCWSNADIRVPGQEGEHIRISREWRMQSTGAAWATGDSIEFLLSVDAPNLDLPALPAGSNTYYLYVSNSPNFTTGTVSAFPMTLQTTLYQVKLHPSFINTTFDQYITFGTRLDTTKLDTSVCLNSSFEIRRSNIANTGVCTRYILDNGTVRDTLYTGDPEVTPIGAVTSNGFCIDTVEISVPAGLPVGAYEVYVDTVVTGLGCAAATYTGGSVDHPLDTVFIDSTEYVGWWSFALDSIYCVGEPNATPLQAAPLGGGVFSIVSTNNGGTIPNLIPNTNTGVIAVNSVNQGTHEIKMVSNGGTSCPDSITYAFTIKPTTTASFGYRDSVVCGGTPIDDTLYTGMSGGLYSVFPTTSSPGVNDSTGVIIPANMDNGNNIITYTPPDSACQAPVDTVVFVSPSTRAVFDYLQDSVCQGSGVIGPFVTNRPTGYFSISPALAGGGFDSNTGYVDLDSVNGSTQYYVTYIVTAGLCQYNAMDSFYVHPAPPVDFSVSDTSLCSGGGLQDTLIRPLGVTTGNFYSRDGRLTIGGNLVGPTPGSLPGGPYFVVFRDTLGSCIDSAKIAMNIIGVPTPVIQYGSSDYCLNEPNPTPSFISGGSGGYFSSPSLAFPALDSTTGRIDLAIATAGVDTIYYTLFDSLCPAPRVVDTVTLHAAANASFALPFPDTLCSDTGSMTLTGLPPNSVISVYSGVDTFSSAISGTVLSVGALPVGVNSVFTTFEIRNVATSGTCVDSSSQYLTVARRDTANITFSPNLICTGDGNPYPFNNGDGGGFFTADTAASGFFFTVDPDSGIIDVANYLQLDTAYQISYTTRGFCPHTDTAAVTVSDRITATFEYQNNQYCISSVDSIVPTNVSNPNVSSIFTSIPGGLVFNASGTIQVAASAPGAYNVSRRIVSSGSCSDESIFSIELVAEDTSTFIRIVDNTVVGLAPDEFCGSALSAQVQIMSRDTTDPDTSGLFSTSTGLIFLNNDDGTINLSASPPGQHVVTYAFGSICGESWSDSLTIVQADDANFSYSSNSFCNGSPNQLPTPVTPGGQYTIGQPSQVRFIGQQTSSSTGEIDVQNSTAEGFTWIFYETSGVCPGRDSVRLLFSAQPGDAVLKVNPPDGWICEGQSVTFEAGGAGGIYRFFRNDTTDFLGNNISYTLPDWTNQDTILVEYTSTGGCKIFKKGSIQVFPIPADSILSFNDLISASDPISVELMSLTPQTSFNWAITTQGEVQFDSLSGFHLPRIDSGVVTVLEILGSLESDVNPAFIRLLIEPVSQFCRGVVDTLEIKVNPNDLDIFVPQVITPDGNGKNDVWQIQFKNGVEPNQYRMQLFNEAGAQVLDMSPVRSDFNGESLPDAVYWYILTDLQGTLIESGGLTIRRK